MSDAILTNPHLRQLHQLLWHPLHNHMIHVHLTTANYNLYCNKCLLTLHHFLESQSLNSYPFLLFPSL